MEHETGPSDGVRVIGTLTGPPLELLLEMVGRAEVMLDLSEVREVESDAVRLLAVLRRDAGLAAEVDVEHQAVEHESLGVGE